MLIGVNGGVEMLLSGTPSQNSSCIYFSNSVYCFGGSNQMTSSLSMRFDLDQNRWIQLTPMPEDDSECNMIIFNGNILISGRYNRNLLLYSIDIDSFSTIPYEFEWDKKKILVNAERLYLIECCGWIYESEIGSYLNWRRIRKSKFDYYSQTYCVYNKGGIYISSIHPLLRQYYYYFDLDRKKIIDLTYYSRNYWLRRVGNKIESIKWNSQNLMFDSRYLDEWDLKGMSLGNLGEHLEDIERNDERIKKYPNSAIYYSNNGYILLGLRRYLEAIEWFDEAIKLKPNYANFYFYKGNAFYGLKRYLEAIECYDWAIKLDPKDGYNYHNKGKSFYGLERYLEAIEWYDEAIELDSYNADFYYNKDKAFYGLKSYLEAIKCYDEAIKLNKFNPNNADFYPKKGYTLNKFGSFLEEAERHNKEIKINSSNAKLYNDKGNTLCVLERYQEAIQCYDEAIKLKPNNPLHFCNRARVFNNLRQEEAALQDFNTAYNLWQQYQEGDVFTKDECKLSEKDIKFIDHTLGRDHIELLQKMQI
ncbi:unnamed protein product [Blepharisma stoltei]|uniref:Tetratricopeptide repeat protein n=1 Tax=Blepharisma stoltei TaxID=1481888 RepID=A0AAU9IQP2_9CILI|nr:unnamed protein product [Blepharisma stoltei]